MRNDDSYEAYKRKFNLGVNVLDLVYLNKHLQGKITIQQ